MTEVHNRRVNNQSRILIEKAIAQILCLSEGSSVDFAAPINVLKELLARTDRLEGAANDNEEGGLG